MELTDRVSIIALGMRNKMVNVVSTCLSCADGVSLSRAGEVFGGWNKMSLKKKGTHHLQPAAHISTPGARAAPHPDEQGPCRAAVSGQARRLMGSRTQELPQRAWRLSGKGWIERSLAGGTSHLKQPSHLHPTFPLPCKWPGPAPLTSCYLRTRSLPVNNPLCPTTHTGRDPIRHMDHSTQ